MMDLFKKISFGREPIYYHHGKAVPPLGIPPRGPIAGKRDHTIPEGIRQERGCWGLNS